MALGLKALRRRIQSIRSTCKITSAMKVVAASRLRKIQHTMLMMRQYADELRKLSALIASRVESEHPLMRPYPEVRREAIVVVSGDRGLCGSFNATITRYVRKKTEVLKEAGVAPVLFFIGQKGGEMLRFLPFDYEMAFVHLLRRFSFEGVIHLVERLERGYVGGEFERVTVVFTRFRSAMTQEVGESQIFPFTENIFAPREFLVDTAYRDFLIEPDVKTVVNYLVPHFAATEVAHDLMESAASELAARMNAMEAATRNAEEMAEKLTIEYYKARQNVITTELMEIVGGVEALKTTQRR